MLEREFGFGEVDDLDVRNGLAEHLDFDRLSKHEVLDRLGNRQRRHCGSPVRFELQQAERRQTLERLAHGNLADPELRSERILADARSRPELAAQQIIDHCSFYTIHG